MKLSLKQLNPNPFKKEINDGKLSEEQLQKILENIEELGLMGSIPVVERENKYYLVSHHHRVEALKRKFGKDFEVEVVVHNYSDSQLIKGMVTENLSQRGMDFREELENVLAVKKYLESKLSEFRTTSKGSRTDLGVHADSREISKFIGQNVLSKTRVCELLKINKNIPQELIQKATNTQGEFKDNTLRYDQLVSLSTIEDKREVKEVAQALLNSENQRVLDHRKFISEYKEADQEIKDKVKSGKIDIAEVAIESFRKEVQKKVEEEKAKKGVKKPFVVIKYSKITNGVRHEAISANDHIDNFCHIIESLNKKNILQNLEWKDIATILDIAVDGGKKYSETAKKMMQVI